MTEEVKSNIGWTSPESMLVMRKKDISYPSYYNAEKNKWGGLLEATVYTGNEIPNMEYAEAVDYRELVGIK